jgi:hypothetical protein
VRKVEAKVPRGMFASGFGRQAKREGVDGSDDRRRFVKDPNAPRRDRLL